MKGPYSPSSETVTFPGRLRALRADWTRRHGRRLTRERLAGALGVAPCTILRWERGGQEPYDCHIEALCKFFGVSRGELGLIVSEPLMVEVPRGVGGGGRGPVGVLPSTTVDDLQHVTGTASSASPPGQSDHEHSDPGDIAVLQLRMGAEQQVISAVARQSTKHAILAGSANLMAATLEQLASDVQRLARSYPQTSPPSLLGEMVRVRNLAYLMLRRTRRPSQVKELYLIAGQVCGLLALNSLDLGCPGPAADHARAAWSYAEIIEHDGLRAWVRGTQAVVAFWSGRAREAIDLATSGQSCARSGPALVRLRSVEARAWALIGDATQTRRAIDASKRALDDDRRDDFHGASGGEFAFSPARQAFCAVASYVQIGDADQAARESDTALELYSAAPVDGRWFRGEFGARADLAAARLMQRELEGTKEALNPVLALPQGWRTARINRRLCQLRHRLAEEPCRSASTARELSERIQQFSAGSIVCARQG
jgi:DNA-binding XRE family transcriptional regulator